MKYELVRASPAPTVPANLAAVPSLAAFWQQASLIIFSAYQSSKSTQRAYLYDLRLWLAFCVTYSVNPWMTQPALATMFCELDKQARALSSVSRTMAGLSTIYDRLRKTNPQLNNPFSRATTDRPSSTAIHPHPAVGADDAAKLMQSVEQDLSSGDAETRLTALRDRAVLALLWATGVRRQFVALAQRSGWSRAGAGAVLRSTWKGGKQKDIRIPAEASSFVQAWLDASTGESLFGLTADQVYALVKRRAKAAGVDPATVKPHGFRAGLATRAYDAGVPEVEIVAAMGHANASTTRQYDRGNRGAVVGETVGQMPRRTT